jgi:hypothetical protein
MLSRVSVPMAGGCARPSGNGKPLRIAVDDAPDTMEMARYLPGPRHDLAGTDECATPHVRNNKSTEIAQIVTATKNADLFFVICTSALTVGYRTQEPKVCSGIITMQRASMDSTRSGWPRCLPPKSAGPFPALRRNAMTLRILEDSVGDAYYIAFNYLKEIGRLSDVREIHQPLLDSIVEDFQAGKTNRLLLANRAIARFEQ